MTAAAAALAAILLLAGPAVAAALTCHKDEHGRELCCERWGSYVSSPGRPDWGVVTGRTFAALEHNLADARRTDRMFCRGGMGDCDNTYGAPHCLGEGRNPSPPQILAVHERPIILQNAELLVSHWTRMLAGAALAYATATGERNPYAGVGSVVRDYGAALTDAREKLRRMAAILTDINRSSSADLFRDLDLLSRDLAQATNKVQSTYALLPPAVRSQLPPVTGPGAGNALPAGQRQAADPQAGAARPSAPDGPAKPRTDSQAAQCPNTESCVDVLDASWTEDRAAGGGTMTIKVRNTCAATIRLGLWIPDQGRHLPLYFSVAPQAAETRTVRGSKNEWTIQASDEQASEACLRYP